FDSVAEYPIAIVLALAARERLRAGAGRPRLRGRLAPGARSEETTAARNSAGRATTPRAVALDLTFALALLALAGLGPRLGGPAWLALTIGAGLPAILLYLAIRSPRRFALGAAGLLGAHLLLPEPDSRTMLIDRTFFGVHRVLVGPDPDREGGSLVRLRHGTTPHGMQRITAAGEPDPTPLLYYHPRGPLGQLFAELD